MDETEIGGWRAWIHGRSLLMVIGGVVTLAVWKFATPGWTQVTAVAYVASSIAYAVRDGWPLRWAIPTTVAVTALFVFTYFADWKAAVVSALYDRTSLPTTTLVFLIVWAVLATVILLVFDRKLQKR